MPEGDDPIKSEEEIWSKDNKAMVKKDIEEKNVLIEDLQKKLQENSIKDDRSYRLDANTVH